ncbi:zinc finger protein 726-like [Ochlerotatus camptorhynchus]|uniref:zinc finger protein 726-like n=1 Tax=Ochlerotatus camptorhynchus TaxID=644619 RepID=UPI0031D1F2A9
MAQTLPEVPSNDPTRFCRLCFSQKSIHWVIRTFGTEVDLPFVNTIGECVGLWLSLEEDFPCAICRRCTKRLEEIIRFRDSCRRCDEAIRNKRSEDPSALVLFYDYPEDKVFINGPAKPGFLPDDPDFESEPILPEVVLDESGSNDYSNSDKRIRMSRTEKQLALKSYMDSYTAWSSDLNRTKDDDEMTIAAPETMAQENLPELSVLCEKYEVTARDSTKQKSKKEPFSISTYTCCFCQQSFRTKEALKGHKQTKHNGSKRQTQQKSKCPDCGQIFMSLYQMRLHAVRHRSNLLISCPTCGIQFISQNELTSHLKNKGCRLKPFGKCKYCDRTFSRRGRYIFHLKKLHPDKPIPSVSGGSKTPRATILPNPQYTDMKRTDSGANSLPIEEHGRFVVMLEPLSLGVPSNPSSDETSSESPFSPPDENEKLVCTLCYERFDDLPAYNTHLAECFNPDDQTGLAPPPYKLCNCEDCTVVFEAVDPFVEHLREHERPLQIKPHDCVQCSSGRQPKFLLHPHSPSMILGD